MNDYTALLAIAAPSVVALASLWVQAVGTRTQLKTERAKIFYQDRITALRGLIKAISEIERSAEQALHFGNVLGRPGGKSFQEVWENQNGFIPSEIHQVIQSSVYKATFMGRSEFIEEVDRNRIFYPKEISSEIEMFEVEYFQSIPNPLHPETIDQFLVQKLPAISSARKRIVEMAREFMMLAA